MICESAGSRSSTDSRSSSFPSSSSSEISAAESDSNDEEFPAPKGLKEAVTLDEFLSDLAEEAVQLGEIDAAFELAERDHSLRDSSESSSDVDERELTAVRSPPSLTTLLPFPINDVNMQRLFYVALLLWSGCTLLRYSLTSEGKLAVRPQPPPAPFFPNTSTTHVRDLYDGNGASRRNIAAMAEIVVLLYYAPWSLHSMEARRPFMEVASSLREFDMVKFAAVNCFHPRGECRRTYKLYSYPVVVAYVGPAVSVVFTEPITSDRLFNWIRHLMQPMERVQTAEDFNLLFTYHHFAVVGYLPLTADSDLSREFTVFHSASMKSTARDGVIFSTMQNADLAAEYGFKRENQLKIFVRGKASASALNVTRATKSTDILDWTYGYLSHAAVKTVQWLNLEEADDGGKSKTLFKVLNSSSTTLVLFSNNFGLPYKSPMLAHLEEAVHSFHDCSNETEAVAARKRALIPGHMRRSMKYCALLTHQDKAEECCEMAAAEGLCERPLTETEGKATSESSFASDTCKYLRELFDEEEIAKKCCTSHHKRRKPHSNRTVKDAAPRTRFLSRQARADCLFYRLLKRTQPSVLAEILRQPSTAETTTVDADLKGLGCRTNRTFTFLAIDKRFSQHFRNLWNVPQQANDSLVAISVAEETIHHFNITGLTKKTVDEFLLNSVSPDLPPIELDESHRKSFFTHHQAADEPALSRLERLTSATFFREIANQTNNLHDSVVFFSGGSAHGPSMSLTYVMHTLKKLFAGFSSLIRFYIIDTSRNSLPWQYRFEALPAVGFFPARSTGQSSVLPKDLPLTVPNAMAFILARCQAELRWRIAIASCSDQCVVNNKRQLSQLSSAIDKDVRSWTAVRPFYAKHGALVDALLKKRLLQRRAGEHLQRLLDILGHSRDHERALSDETKDLLVRDSLFVRWILANRFGATYKSL